MADLNALVTEAMNDLSNGTAIREMIDKKLEATVSAAIESAIGIYSEFGKMMKERITEKLCVNLDNVNLDEYAHTMIGMIEGHVNRAVSDSAREKLFAELNELFAPPPARITLQEIITDFAADNVDDYHRKGAARIGLVFDMDSGSFFKALHVGLHPNPDEGGTFTTKPLTYFGCEVRLSLHRKSGEENVYVISYAHMSGDSTRNFLPTCLPRISRRLYQMYCAGTEIVVDSTDADDYDTAYDRDQEA